MKLEVGKRYQVVVSHTVPAGAVVKLEDSTTELIHLSNISDKFVKNPAEFVVPGETYQAECITGYNGKIQLSLKHLKLRSTVSEAEQFANAVNAIPIRPKKEAVQNKPRYYNTKPVTDRPKTLDEMIEESTKVMQEKLRAKKKNVRNRK